MADAIREALQEANETLCGEWHLGGWPDCDDEGHEPYVDALAALKELEAALSMVELITAGLNESNISRGEGYSGTVALAVLQLQKAVALEQGG